ncbi:MAG: EamA/RhaT family transporter, partial [Rhodospirillaceae bacterium]|nr:EamA/RhaT family transporter [Rhodospirillaceae bacterium]
PITFCLAFYVWRWPDLTQLAMLAAVGFMVGGAHFTMTMAYNRSEVSALEPFNFIRLIIAALIGFFVFSELPDIWTWAGGAIIVASTSYIARREAVLSREAKFPAA